MACVQVKEQTLREREQAGLRLQETHQAEQNAIAHLQAMRKDCRSGPCPHGFLLCKLKNLPAKFDSLLRRLAPGSVFRSQAPVPYFL